MKQTDTRKRQHTTHPLAKLNLRIQLTEDDILADLQYPARTTRTARRRP